MYHFIGHVPAFDSENFTSRTDNILMVAFKENKVVVEFWYFVFMTWLEEWGIDVFRSHVVQFYSFIEKVLIEFDETISQVIFDVSFSYK